MKSYPLVLKVKKRLLYHSVELMVSFVALILFSLVYINKENEKLEEKEILENNVLISKQIAFYEDIVDNINLQVVRSMEHMEFDADLLKQKAMIKHKAPVYVYFTESGRKPFKLNTVLAIQDKDNQFRVMEIEGYLQDFNDEREIKSYDYVSSSHLLQKIRINNIDLKYALVDIHSESTVRNYLVFQSEEVAELYANSIIEDKSFLTKIEEKIKKLKSEIK